MVLLTSFIENNKAVVYLIIQQVNPHNKELPSPDYQLPYDRKKPG